MSQLGRTSTDDFKRDTSLHSEHTTIVTVCDYFNLLDQEIKVFHEISRVSFFFPAEKKRKTPAKSVTFRML